MPAKKPMSKRAPKSRADAKRETREALIEAAIALFGERGLDAPSLDDICERAGFTRGAFYVHFADRDDLLRVAMERVGARTLDALLGAAPEAADFSAVAMRFLGALASGEYPLTKVGGVRPFQLLDACARSPAIRKQYVALVDESVARLGVILRGAQRGELLRDDVAPEDLARLLVMVIIGLQTLLDLEVTLDVGALTQTLLGLFSPTPAPPPRRAKARRAR